VAAALNGSATARTTALSLALWLRNASWVKAASGMGWAQVWMVRGQAPLTLPK
jgi:hypothetical protein